MAKLYGLLVLTLLVWGPSPGYSQTFNEHIRHLLDFYVPTESDNTKCRADSILYVDSAMAQVDWALTMFDSSAMVPNPGLRTGSMYDLGNFDACLELTNNLTDVAAVSFVPQYCLADVHMDLTPENVMQSLVLKRRLRWAFCIPDSCSRADLEVHLENSLNTLLAGTGVATVTIKEQNCRILNDDRAVLDWGTILTIVIFCLIGALVIVASIVDYLDIKAGKKRADASKGKMVILAFSGYTNGMGIFNLNRVKGSIDCVNGMRWFSIMWVMMGHRYGKENDMPAINHDEVLQNLMYYWPEMILMNAYLAVETFFVLGGMLLSYIFMKGMDVTKKFDIITFYVYRYIRLTPPLALVIWIYARVLIHTGWGPLWYEQVGEKTTNCEARWWVNLLYVNNYVYPRSDEACVPQTWYLAVDMQLFVASPVLLYPLWRWPKAGYAIAAALLAGGLFAPYYITVVNEFPWQSDWSQTGEEKMAYFINMYNTVWTRSVPYVCGILLGYFLYKIRDKKIVLKWYVVACGWIVCAGVGLSIIFTLSLNYTKEPYNPWEAGAYNSFHRLGWGCVISWMIFACHRGYGGPVNTFLSWSYFQPLARLSYCAYLSHIMVQLADLGTIRTTTYYSQFRTIHKLPGDFLFILLGSLVINLVSETPILILEKTFLKRAPKPKPIVEAVKSEP